MTFGARIKTIVVLVMVISTSQLSFAQAIDPNKSAKAAARSDVEFISSNIRDNEDAIFLSRKAVERSKDERVKELAQLMVDNHIAILYSMEQLGSAGKGVAGKNTSAAGGSEPAAVVNEKLSSLSGPVFDSVWVSSLLPIQQAKYDEYTAAKETVTNGQLKLAVSQALPLLRKHISQLKSTEKYLVRLAIQKRKEEAAAKKAKQS